MERAIRTGSRGARYPTLSAFTIVDIFAALIEGLCYKSASSCDAAYQVLLDMGARLDSRLVEEFRAVLPSLAGIR